MIIDVETLVSTDFAAANMIETESFDLIRIFPCCCRCNLRSA